MRPFSKRLSMFDYRGTLLKYIIFSAPLTMLERAIAEGRPVAIIGRRIWDFEWYQINDIE